MFVAQGITVNGGWTKAIAMSPNGSEWETVRHDSINKIMRVFLPNVKLSPANNGYAFNDLAQVIIELNDGSDIRFDVQKVTNQPTWRTNAFSGGTAVSVQAGLEAAVSDLTIWHSV